MRPRSPTATRRSPADVMSSSSWRRNAAGRETGSPAFAGVVHNSSRRKGVRNLFVVLSKKVPDTFFCSRRSADAEIAQVGRGEVRRGAADRAVDAGLLVAQAHGDVTPGLSVASTTHPRCRS